MIEEIFLKELKEIDEKFIKIKINSNQSILFYELIEKNIEITIKIFKTIQEYTQKKKYSNSYINHINEHVIDIEYSKFNIIKNKKTHSIAIISCAIIWALNETSQYKYTSINNSLPHNSYNVINEIIDFINIFKGWNAAYNKEIILTYITKKDHNSNVYRLITILIHEKIIKTENIYIKWLKKKKTCYVVENFKTIKIIKIHTKSLEYKKIKNNSILLGEHYSSCWELFIPNNNNNSIFELKKDDIIEIMSKEYTNIDFEHYEDIVNIYFKEHNLKEEDIESNYICFLKEYKLAIKQNNENLISNLSKKLSIYQKGIELKEILKIKFDKDEKFFFPWNYDFRGRTYYLSDISFTFNKEFRWCMYKNYYETIEDLKPNWHAYNWKITKILNKHTELLKKLNMDLEDNVYLKQLIIWLLISLGEVNKSKIGYKIHISEFIEEGIKIFNENEKIINNFEYEDKIKIITLIKTIKEFEKDIKKKK